MLFNDTCTHSLGRTNTDTENASILLASLAVHKRTHTSGVSPSVENVRHYRFILGEGVVERWENALLNVTRKGGKKTRVVRRKQNRIERLVSTPKHNNMIVSVLRNSYPGDAYDDDDNNNNNSATTDDTVRFCLDFALFARRVYFSSQPSK